MSLVDYFSADYHALDYWGADYYGGSVEEFRLPALGGKRARKGKVKPSGVTPTVSDLLPNDGLYWGEQAERRRAEAAERKAQETRANADRLQAALEAADGPERRALVARLAQEAEAKQAAAKRAEERLKQRKVEKKAAQQEEALIEQFMLEAAEEENRLVLAVVRMMLAEIDPEGDYAAEQDEPAQPEIPLEAGETPAPQAPV